MKPQILLEDKRAYEVLQKQVEDSFAKDLNMKPEDVRNIVIVGAWHGQEIGRLLKNYINALIFAFEPYPKYYRILTEKYVKNDRVYTYNKAVTNRVSRIKFYELPMTGNGSILKPVGKIKEEITVDCTTLKHELEDLEIDLLWVDVQGAEMHVLQGTNIEKCKSMFLEVFTLKAYELYEKQCYMNDLFDYLDNTHELYKLGLDNENKNGIGNSFWVRKDLIRKVVI